MQIDPNQRLSDHKEFFFWGGGAGGKSRTSATVFFNLGQARVLMVTFINFCIYKTVFVITKK